MISTPTLFVLGAGASIPYGFPSGARLREVICRMLHGPDFNFRCDQVAPFGFEPADVKRFVKAFLYSSIQSIDAFLARRTEFSSLGKLLIASYIGAGESRESLFGTNNDDKWYHALWNAMLFDVHKIEELASNRVRFVSFNYDRSLECFLHEATKNAYGVEDEIAIREWSKLAILHVYGSLGKFCFQPMNDGRIYRSELSQQDLAIASSGIRVIPEARDDDDNFALARNWFDWATRIYFLGFGFDPLNIRRLDLASVIEAINPQQRKLTTVYASTFGLTDAEASVGKAALCAGHQKFHLGNPSWKNLQFIREYALLP